VESSNFTTVTGCSAQRRSTQDKYQDGLSIAGVPPRQVSSALHWGIRGLVASEPLTASIASAIPFLTFAVRLDPLSFFFVLTISLVGLAASIYVMGYLKRYMISV